MSPDAPEDDDRTVIRPPGPPTPTSAPVPVPPPAATDDDRTVIARTPIPAFDRTQVAGAPPPPAAAEADAGSGLPIGTYLGEFELTQYVAEGGFGIVYMAYDHSLQRRVALKEYMPSSLASRAAGSQVSVKSERHRETFAAGLKSFINEARLLASFDHPSLLKVYRFWEANGTAYMVMPFLEGTTLKDRLRELGERPDEDWLRGVLGPLTEALLVIHAEQCYHRDIAPDNIMLLAGSNRALLMDFGASRRVIGDMTQALTVILKPGYAPVEQYAEIPGMKQGPWTDVYALAAVVYFAITGKTPPPSVGRLLNDTYVPLVESAAGHYSEAFLAAIDRGLIVRPEERTQSIGQLREELGLATATTVDPYTTRPLSPGEVPPRPPPAARATAPPAAVAAPPAAAASSKRPLVAIGAGVLVLGAVAFGAYSVLTPAPRPAPADAAPAATAPAAPAAVEVATAPPPAPVAAPPAAAVFDVPAEFEKVVQGQSGGFNVRAQALKPVLKIDRDELAFTVDADRDGYLYVLAFGADGALFQLYPNTESGTLRVRKGQIVRLPQPPIYFATTEPPGSGQLLVMVSARQRDHRALQPKPDGPFRVFPTGTEALRLAAGFSGAPSALAGNAICPSAEPCADEYGAAIVKVETVR